MVEDIITTLSRVIACIFSFAYKGRAVDLRGGRQATLACAICSKGSVAPRRQDQGHCAAHRRADRIAPSGPERYCAAARRHFRRPGRDHPGHRDGNAGETHQGEQQGSVTRRPAMWKPGPSGGGCSFATQTVSKDNWGQALALWQKAPCPARPRLVAALATRGLVSSRRRRALWLGGCTARPRSPRDCLRDAEKALSVDPENADAHIWRATT